MVRQVAQVPHGLRMFGLFQFFPVAPAELGEQARVVAVPLAEFVRRRDVPAPFIESGLGLGQPSRPQPVDEDPGAVLRPWLFVDPANLDRSTCHGMPLAVRITPYPYHPPSRLDLATA